jgi:hypothetical protein
MRTLTTFVAQKFFRGPALSMGLVINILFTPIHANAATRTAYFNQQGMNRTINGIAQPGATSTCRITISNPSQQAQTYTLRMSVSSLDSWAGGDSGTSRNGSYTAPATSTGSATMSNACASNACTGSLPSNSSITITYSFQRYLSRYENLLTGYQKLRCSGSIEAVDTTQPGFLVASGVLVTFVESTKMQTEGVTGGSTATASFGGMAVYTQVPITINKGKPF